MVYQCIEAFVCYNPKDPMGSGYRPTIDDLRQAKTLAMSYPLSVVHLRWYIRYAGWKSRFIDVTTDIEEMAKEIAAEVYAV